MRLVFSLIKAGWRLSYYKRRIKWAIPNRVKDTYLHVYSWLKWSPVSPVKWGKNEIS